MLRIMKTTLTTVVVFLMLAVGQSQADLVYEFSGFLPSDINEPDFLFDRDTDMQTGPDTVELGDSWTLTVAIDLVDDGDPGDPNYGDYVDAARSGKLVFSSGYEATFTIARTWGDIFVLDNLISAGLPEVDGVAVSMAEGGVLVDAGISTETNLAALSSDALPGLPFDPFSQSVNGGDEVLYFETPGGGLISYFSDMTGTFTVVPEPSSITLWCAVLGLGGVFWRKRRAA